MHLGPNGDGGGAKGWESSWKSTTGSPWIFSTTRDLIFPEITQENNKKKHPTISLPLYDASIRKREAHIDKHPFSFLPFLCPSPMAPTTQPRQLFLQALLSQPSLSYEKALSLHQRCLEICYGEFLSFLLPLVPLLSPRPSTLFYTSISS